MSRLNTDSDKTRVLRNILVHTTRSPYGDTVTTKEGVTIHVMFGQPAPQFMSRSSAELIGMPLVPGDIVKCSTNPNHDWGIAEYVEDLPAYSSSLLREIGSTRLVRMINETLEVLRFMPPHWLLTGLKYKMYRFAMLAFYPRYNPYMNGDHRFRYCGGVEVGDESINIWVRPHLFEMEMRRDEVTIYAQPRRIVVPYSRKTRLKDIVEALEVGGFSWPFEYTLDKPMKGTGGIAIFTREQLVRDLGLHPETH